MIREGKGREGGREGGRCVRVCTCARVRVRAGVCVRVCVGEEREWSEG